ncbi:MAG: TIR domain-containing protein, partial [Planctomycetota bacterium]|nr:TIR domain-containing protein [Planctomycetota bacterium]
MPTESQMPRRFAIAVSFPGQHRRFVRNVVKRLAEVLDRDRVFYDKWYETDLAGPNGDLELRRVYREQSDLVVPFFSEYYEKPWCGVEWDTIRTILLKRRKDRAVVPVEMDGTRIEGWEETDYAFRRKGRSGRQIADLILDVYEKRFASVPKPEETTPASSLTEPATHLRHSGLVDLRLRRFRNGCSVCLRETL